MQWPRARVAPRRVLVAKLTAMGFSRVFHLTPEKAKERYLESRTDSLTAPSLEQMIRATA